MTKGWVSVKKRTEEWANPPKASHLLTFFAEARSHRMFTAHGWFFTFIPATFAFAGSPEPGRLLLPGLLQFFLQSPPLMPLLLAAVFLRWHSVVSAADVPDPASAAVFWRSSSCFANIFCCCCWYLRSRFQSPVLAAADPRTPACLPAFCFRSRRRMSGGQRYSPKVDGCGCITSN